MNKFVLLFTALTIVSAGDILSDTKCNDNVNCIEASLIRRIDDYDENPQISMFDGAIVFTKNGFSSKRSSEGLLERLSTFIANRDLKINLQSTLSAAGKFLSEARSSKMKKFVVPFIILMILKKSIEVPIFLAIVTLVAFKALGAGLISLVLSASTAFKSLLEHHHSSSKVSYEVVPQIASSHWSRSGSIEDYPILPGYHTIAQI